MLDVIGVKLAQRNFVRESKAWGEAGMATVLFHDLGWQCRHVC